jgi:phosphoglycolate phosphatase-like HAD superfamily hydrolase
VYFGDGVWDARACRDLRIPFVGIGSGARAELLRAEGAVAVMADYAEIATVAAATLAAQQRYRASEHEW